MSDDNGERPVGDIDLAPIVVTLTYTQTAHGPTIKVECEQEVYPDVLVDILMRAARFQERELIVQRMAAAQMQGTMQAMQINRAMGKRKN
jgi:hypothetical protein